MSVKKADSISIEEIEKKKFLNTKELAAYLGKSSAWVTGLATRNVIPFIHPPRSTRIFERVAVMEVLEKKYGMKGSSR